MIEIVQAIPEKKSLMWQMEMQTKIRKAQLIIDKFVSNNYRN